LHRSFSGVRLVAARLTPPMSAVNGIPDPGASSFSLVSCFAEHFAADDQQVI
jgi:hypothetical protein